MPNIVFRSLPVVVLSSALALAGASVAEAANEKNKNGQGGGRVTGEARGHGKDARGTSDEALLERAVEIVAEAFLTERERRIIREAFSSGYPPGFKKPKPIPPGIRKKLARGGTLPPGIARTRLPATVLERLPRRHGEDIVFIDRDVYLIRKSTRLILDVLRNVL